jgi:transcription initiation factor TFIID subunit TAF12
LFDQPSEVVSNTVLASELLPTACSGIAGSQGRVVEQQQQQQQQQSNGNDGGGVVHHVDYDEDHQVPEISNPLWEDAGGQMLSG